MNTDTQLFWDLSLPFPASQIEWRVGATTKDKDRCIALAYVDARTVQRRLDEVLGPFMWETHTQTPHLCSITIHLPDGRSITRTDAAGDTQVEAEKGAFSTAFKRAAAQFGVGRYLYSLPNTWVAYRSAYDFDKPELPSWATPEGYMKLRPRPEGARYA